MNDKTTTRSTEIKLIAFYLIILLLIISAALLYNNSTIVHDELVKFHLIFNCILIGGVGGILYGLRSVYINNSVKKNWDKSWEIWYYLRPIVSLITGGISFLVIKAGLLVLEANLKSDSSHFGIFVLALIAGLNVDRFISKIEDLAQATWGIEKSRSSKRSDKSVIKEDR